jgi:tripartite-type tricarboxylate transporter receptor subunit TctC
MLRFFLLALSILTTLSAAPAARAQGQRETYPARPIVMVVPFAAGGPTDIVARMIADGMSRVFGQQVSVENIVGSGGTTAGLRVKRADPDGYTIMMGHLGTHAAVTGYLPNVYDPVQDFVAVGLAVHAPVALVVRAGLPARDMAEFIAYAKANVIVMGHAGVGSVSFATCAQLNREIGLAPKSMAFNGTQPAMEALTVGRVDYMCDQAPSVVSHVAGGKIRVLAVSSQVRVPVLPDAPTAVEAGEPGFALSSWMGLFAPRDTPPAVVARLNAALGQALQSEELNARLAAIGVSAPENGERSQAYFERFVRDEAAHWPEIVKSAAR